MTYSVSMLTSIAECDAVLTMANREKASLEFRKVTLNRQKTEMSENGTEVDQYLTAVRAEVTALQNVVAALPAGPTKDAQETRLVRAELRLRILTKKDLTYGVGAMLELELDIARAEKELEEVNAFISDINAKKATL